MSIMAGELILDAPEENFKYGLVTLDLPPTFGEKQQGKVRDFWVIPDAKGNSNIRVMFTSDRQSAFDRVVGTIPGKGASLNLMTAFWMFRTEDIVANQISLRTQDAGQGLMGTPHPNITVCHDIKDTLPVEVVIRGHMAKSSTTTSIYHNYQDLGRREIYGIRFPEGLQANQEFPLSVGEKGIIITPTTKAEMGQHDQELTDEEARVIVDSKYEKGAWKKAKLAATQVFSRAKNHMRNQGLILVDTKYEFGMTPDGELVLIDEVNTSDSSRIWLAKTYPEKMARGENPETYDKEILRRWLADSPRNFRRDGPIPVLSTEVVEQMATAYRNPYLTVTGGRLPMDPARPEAIQNNLKSWFPHLF